MNSMQFQDNELPSGVPREQAPHRAILSSRMLSKDRGSRPLMLRAAKPQSCQLGLPVDNTSKDHFARNSTSNG